MKRLTFNPQHVMQTEASWRKNPQDNKNRPFMHVVNYAGGTS